MKYSFVCLKKLTADLGNRMYYAGLCAIARDEDHVLAEWTAYHLRVGFEHIWLYDNESRIPISQTLQPFVERGLVTVMPMEGRRRQLFAYGDCLKHFGGQCAWLGFVDLDEFVVPRVHDDVRNLLETYESFGGLGLHWLMFGSDGHTTRPEAGVLRSYTSVVDRNAHIKSFVRPRAVSAVVTPHSFAYRNGLYCVNEDGIPILGHRSYHTSERACINHYYYQSEDDFARKVTRPMVTGPKDGSCKRNPTDEWHAYRAQAARCVKAEKDTAVQRFLPGRSVAQDMALTLTQPLPQSADSFSLAISAAVTAGNPALAMRLAQNCLRRFPEPQIWLMAAKLAILVDDRPTCFNALGKLLADTDSPFREPAFLTLKEAYAHFGPSESASALHGMLYGQG